MRLSISVMCVALCVSSSVSASTIKLTEQKTKATFNAAVLRIDDDGVIIRLPRDTVSTVDGKPLPAVLRAGVAAPPFSVHDILGQTQTMDAKQGRATVLHFWVHWCPHCRSDAPQIQAVYDQFHDHPGVRVLTVNLDQERARIDQFIQEHHVTYPVIFAAEQATQPGGVNLTELYQITGFPVTYLIDAQGVIRQKFTGSFSESGNDLKALVAKLVPDPGVPKPALKKGER